MVRTGNTSSSGSRPEVGKATTMKVKSAKFKSHVVHNDVFFTRII